MIPFPFIGSSIPEGHQGQSVEGMSHGSVIAKLKHGFHTNRYAVFVLALSQLAVVGDVY